jgi:ligand-binding sensor domain-containing protein
VEDGLPQTQVYALSSDDQGYLWLGTAGGAARFNGKEFKHYGTSNGLVDNIVSDVIQYGGYTWVFTNKGVTRITGKEVVTYDLTDALKGSYVAAAGFRSATNTLILANKDDEVYEINLNDQGELLLETSNEIMLDVTYEHIRKIYEDNGDDTWIVGDGLLGYLDINNTWNSITIEGSALNVSDIEQDKNGDYWLSVYDEGIYHWRKGVIKHYSYADGLISSLIRNIFIDTEGRVWCASKSGVSVLREDGFSNFYSKNGLPSDNIETICEDREGNIWLASDGAGAFRFTSDEFVNYHASSGLHTEYVMTGFQDRMGGYWYGTYNSGVVHFDGTQYQYYNVENDKILNNVVWSSLEDSKGRLWFGTSNGLSLFEENEITNFSTVDWLPSNKVTSIFEFETEDEIWLGTSKGLGIVSPDTSYAISSSDNISLKNIRSIARGVNNQIWLGTSNGIVVSDGSFFEPWINNDQLEDKLVYCIENFKDSLWFIGTSNGLYYTDGINVERMLLHSSFGANFINFLALERDRYLWVGSNNGVFEVDLTLYLESSDQGVLHHRKNSGLKSVETNLNAVFVDDESRVWMGTGNGTVRFDRSKRRNEIVDLIPLVQIEEMQLDLKYTDWSKYTENLNAETQLPDQLSLSSRENYLTFYFEGVSLSHPDEVVYKIKLDGLDDDWTPPISQSSFTYPNLAYGSYTFNVIASVDGKNWSDPVSLTFEIRKPYYLTWWFIALMLMVGTGLIYLIYHRRRLAREQKAQTEKLYLKSRLLALEQQTLNASMNRHFIFNALNSIQYYINTQDRISANKYLTSFAKLIRKNLDSSVNDTGTVSLNDELERLELYISLEHMRFQKKFDYEIDVDKSLDQESIQIPPMILQPFVENSIWHGLLPQDAGGKIWIRIFQRGTNVVFEIEDNGIGIDESRKTKTDNAHHSKGMLITSGRIEILKKVTQQKMTIVGPYQLNDENGAPNGTRVELVLERNM